MIWWVLSTFLAGFSTIFRKKSMTFETGLWKFGFMFLGRIGAILYIIYFLLWWDIWSEIVTVKNVSLVTLICLFWTGAAVISQYVYKVEKISLIAPYENLNKILSIIFSFFIFSDVSFISLSIAIFVVAIIFISSFDFKNKKIPKTIQIFSLNQFLLSINTILIGYLLLQVSAVEYFVLENIIGIFLLLLIIIFNKDIHRLRRAWKKFYFNRIGASMLGISWYILSLYVISTFGVTINILLSFLYLGFILILSYFMLGDKPTFKSITVSIVVTLLVGIGFYFR